MAFDTFDTDSIATAGITFTNGNLTAQGITGSTVNSAGIAQALEGKTSGKWYVEFTCVAVSGNIDGVGVVAAWGIGTNTGGQGGYMGGTSGSGLPSGDNGWGYYTTGNIFNKAVIQTAVNNPTFTTADVIGVAIDLDNGRLWWRKNTGSWAGTGGSPDPATNTSGFDISHMTNSGSTRLYPAADLSGPAAKFTANFGASSFTGGVPSGFTSGWTNTTAGTYFGTFATTGKSGNFFVYTVNLKAVAKYTSTFSGYIGRMRIPFGVTATGNLKGLIYDASGVGGLPGALLGISNTVSVTTGDYGEIEFTFSGVPIVNATAYWFGFVSDIGGHETFCPPATALIAQNTGTYASPTNPFGAGPTTFNFRYPMMMFPGAANAQRHQIRYY